MVSKKHILIISGRDTSVEMLKDLPIKVTLFQTPDRVTSLQHEIAERVISFNLNDNIDELKKLIRTIHSIDPFDGAVSFIEDFLIPTAEVVEELGIKGNPVKPVQITRDKIKMREHLFNFDIPTVKYKKCNSKDDVKTFLKMIEAPIILKPSHGAGSMKISLVNNIDDIENVWHKNYREEDNIIAEEYIRGEEYSVEAISVSGKHEVLAFTEKETTGNPHFIEVGHRQPAQLEEHLQREMENVVLKFLESIEHKEGPTHTEVRVRDGIPYIIEGHTRYGGDRIWELLYITTGIHIQQTTVCNLLGINPPINSKNYEAAAIKFLTNKPMTCKEIKGIDEVNDTDGIYKFHLDLSPGQSIKPLKSSEERLGYIIGGAEDVKSAWIKTSSAASGIEIL